jgi:electron transfer flavoprotein alpha/beta subunit
VLPADQRPTELASLVKQLRDSADEVSRVAEESLPAVGDYLRTMSVAASETSQLLLAPPEAEAPAGPATETGAESRSLLETVVWEGLRLAEEKDPLQRADSCSAVAEQLVQTILLASAMGEVERAAMLGQCLSEMADRGVAANLNRVEMNEADTDGLAELERVRQRAAAAEAALQSNWQRAPSSARKGLEQAMEASRSSLERAAHAGKSKGKLKPKDKHPHRGKPSLPPGLEKKRERDAAPSRGEREREPAKASPPRGKVGAR